jgi:pyrroline-5-carboxylate reductase
MEKTIGFIGSGRVTNIFLQAFNNKNISLKNVSVYDTNAEVSEKLKQKFPEISISDLNTVSSREIVFIALHPPVIMDSLNSIKDFINKNSIFISLAPKITIEKISSVVGNQNVARLIPNATSFINKGYNPVTFAPGFGNKKEIMDMLLVLGKTFETAEPKLEAFAIASAMLPTYFWFQWYQMIEIAGQIGLTHAEAEETVQETLLASLDVMFKSGLKSAEVYDLIPVKPIGENEGEIKEILQKKLIGLFEKIKP